MTHFTLVGCKEKRYGKVLHLKETHRDRERGPPLLLPWRQLHENTMAGTLTAVQES